MPNPLSITKISIEKSEAVSGQVLEAILKVYGHGRRQDYLVQWQSITISNATWVNRAFFSQSFPNFPLLEDKGSGTKSCHSPIWQASLKQPKPKKLLITVHGVPAILEAGKEAKVEAPALGSSRFFGFFKTSDIAYSIVTAELSVLPLIKSWR
ncbi:unnamed protein product [Dovyalis caffra]|uniref:Uncharacterized protein n=1 Tax=Dovyalis caffra TaxID=77055 RepID=A0AAV1SUK0_9ROSI|nr:unnamed protein product [Dovyalis caffra]